MIGANITQLRRQKGMTLTELAEKANISKSNLSNIERNINTNPSIRVLERLAEVLDTDVVTLLGMGEEDNTQDYYEEFLQRLRELNLTREELEEYERVLEFIEWKKKKSRT
ncbi:transcriptional regulator [Alkalicoccus saliphilus]|uniref:Transcriptional regulator n=2 Tax=Alkalicoccus saliphilus TaxID=200989 RepID=A0A2T4UA11_9BACI|nr:helix-turn-helix transcriptional regulator [Alkalicoccus saliphilus]PTL40231.1 transcriptional regulator [Alkalicoccus saliphilus]